MTRWLGWSLCAGILLLTITCNLFGQVPDQQLERILAAWKERQQRFTSVRYRVGGIRVMTAELFREARNRPKRDVTAAVNRTYVLDFVKDRFRVAVEEEHYDPDAAKLHPMTQTRVYDGKQAKALKEKEKNTHPLLGVRPGEAEVGVGSGYLGHAMLELNHWPAFLGHGCVPSKDDNVIPGKLKVLPQRKFLYIHGKGVHKGKTCVVVRTNPRQHEVFDEWWIDPSLDYAVVKQITYAFGTIAQYEFDVEYQKASGDAWLPKRWVFTERDCNSGKLLFTERLAVTEVVVDPPLSDTDFVIEEKAGMLVREAVYSTPRPGKLDSPVTRLFKIRNDGTRMEINEDGTERRQYLSWWIGGILLMVGIAGLALCLLRRLPKQAIR